MTSSPFPTDMRAHIASLNNESLMALLRQTSITLGSNALEWRPTKPVSGHIPGLFGRLTILMTDGVVAWFRQDDGQYIYAHIAAFDGKVQPLHSVPPPSKAGERSEPRQRRKGASKVKANPVANALAMLASLSLSPSIVPEAEQNAAE